MARPNFIPTDVYDYIVATYETPLDLVQRRNLNRATRERYLARLPELAEDRSIVDYAIRAGDVSLFDDWMRTREEKPVGWTDPNLSVYLLEEIARYNPSLITVLMSYPKFTQTLQHELERVLIERLGYPNSFIDSGRRREDKTARFLGLLLWFDTIADLVLLPRFQAAPSDLYEILWYGSFWSRSQAWVLARLVEYAESRGITLTPQQADDLLGLYFQHRPRRYPRDNPELLRMANILAHWAHQDL